MAGLTPEKRIPDDISYVLRTTLTEGGVQFLSLQQIDSVIEYFTRERDRLTGPQARPPPPSQQQQAQYHHQMQQQTAGGGQYQNLAGNQSVANQSVANSVATASNLLDNPQVKAALTSLLNIGAIGNSSNGNGMTNNTHNLAIGNEVVSSSDAPSYMSTTGPGASRHYLDNSGGGGIGGGGGLNSNGIQGGMSRRHQQQQQLGLEIGPGQMQQLQQAAGGGGLANRGSGGGGMSQQQHSGYGGRY